MDPFSVPTLTTVLGRLLPEPQAGLLAGILFGTRASLSKDLTDAFITTGTIHVIALSGQNVAIVTSLVASSLVHLVSRRIASLLTLLVVGLFLWFVGPSPSLVRAVIMGSLALISTIFGRRNWSLFSLVLAVTLMLVLNPLWITDLGFQLSVLATLGIILFGSQQSKMFAGHSQSFVQGAPASILKSTEDPSQKSLTYSHVVGDGASLSEEGQQFTRSSGHYRASLKNVLPMRLGLWGGQYIRQAIIDNLRLTLAAQLFTTPLILVHFRRISLIAPITNVLIGWTMPVLMMFGWTSAIAGYIWLPLGALPAWGSWVLLTFVIRVVELTAGLPMASLAW